MMSGGCGALRMTMAFSLESLSAGNPCDFHRSSWPSDERKLKREKAGLPLASPPAPPPSMPAALRPADHSASTWAGEI